MPIQIHLGYLSLMFEGEIPPGQRAKLLRNLRRKWMQCFQSEDVDVDWVDAQHKLDQLRALRADAPGLVFSNAGSRPVEPKRKALARATAIVGRGAGRREVGGGET
jgi:hypothetical protein